MNDQKPFSSDFGHLKIASKHVITLSRISYTYVGFCISMRILEAIFSLCMWTYVCIGMCLEVIYTWICWYISDWTCEQIRRSCWTSTSGAHCGCCTVCGSGYMYIPYILLRFSFLFSRSFQTYYHRLCQMTDIYWLKPLGLDFSIIYHCTQTFSC